MTNMTDEDKARANQRLVRYLDRTIDETAAEARRLRSRVGLSYWIVVTMSVVMFLVGIALLVVPLVQGFGNGQDTSANMASGIAGGVGIADLIALFLLRPFQRIQGMMGDMSQLTVALNSYRTQVALRLLQMDISDRDSIGQTAENVKDSARAILDQIQVFFEGQKKES